MSIAEKIERLSAAKNDIATAISGKGVSVADTDGFEEFADKINEIESGSSTPKKLYVFPSRSSDNLVGISADEVITTNLKLITPNITLYNLTVHKTKKGFIAASSRYISYYSTNGYEWESINIEISSYYKPIILDDGECIFYDSNKYILYQFNDDNKSLEKITSVSRIINGFVNGFFYCYSSGVLSISSDYGETWTDISIDAEHAGYTISRIVYSNGVYLADVNAATYGLMYSKDLQNWSFPSNHPWYSSPDYPIATSWGFFAKAHRNSTYYAIYYSYDGGKTWAEHSLGTSGSNVVVKKVIGADVIAMYDPYIKDDNNKYRSTLGLFSKNNIFPSNYADTSATSNGGSIIYR